MKPLLDCIFQPILNRAGNVYAFEALMRFKGYPDRSPFPVIRRWEKSGYIEMVDLMMIDIISEAVKATTWKPRIHINASVRTIEAIGNLYLDRLAVLRPLTRQLVIEITESVAINSPLLFLRFVNACRAQGYHIALDDCVPGHPYAGEKFMQSVRPSIVKIDGKFFQESMRTDDSDELDRVIRIAHQTKASVIIEHVSSVTHQNYAFMHGADMVQGFETSMPRQNTNCTFGEQTVNWGTK